MPFFVDTLKVYEKLSKYCNDNGLYVGHIISEIIHEFLIKEGVVKKE